MKNLIFVAALTLGLSASADLQRFAIVRGTNVLFWTQYDTLRPPTLPSGVTNIAITEVEASVIQPGWTYANGEFRDKTGALLDAGIKTRIDRTKLIDAAIAELNSMQVDGATALTNWATLTAGQKDTAQKRTIQAVVKCSLILELLLKEQRALLELKETAQ